MLVEFGSYEQHCYSPISDFAELATLFFLKESLSSAIIKLCRKNSDTTDYAYGNVLMRVLFTGIHYTNVALKNQLSYWKCTSQLSQ